VNPDDLLAQATCAVLSGSPATTTPKAIGTAWLASATGYLLTAGHVVQDWHAGDDVWVRFTDTDPVAATLYQAKFDKAQALDFALLQLREPTSRTPLPIQLVAHLQGEVLVRGYGSNLPKAQSGTTAPAGLVYLRSESRENYYFPYRSRQLSAPGYSGAAVYSTSAGAVVALQTEAKENDEIVLAMPLVRITDYWQELVTLAHPAPRGRCVLLVPAARGAAGVQALLDDIIRPVVQGMLNLDIYVSTVGATTKDDLAELEKADVVIADATDDDQNVTYELTVAQGIGTPDVVFVEPGRQRPNMPFTAVELDLHDPARARETLTARLLSVRAVFEALGETATSNPITDFFRAPLTQVSAANALSLGYYLNFVRPVGYELIGAAAGIPTRISVDGRDLDADRAGRVNLTVVVPDRLRQANDGYIDRHVRAAGRAVRAQIHGRGWSRPRTMMALPQPDDDGVTHLLDVFPTTTATLIEAIDQRLGISEPSQRSVTAWPAIERKEIDRFASGLVRRIRTDGYELGGRALRDVCTVAGAAAMFTGLPDA
jgi:hypothetical protein